MSSDQPIGVFDSGVGGLTVVKALGSLLPSEHLVYLGDTARVPYGTKSAEVVTRYSLLNAAFLLKHDIKALVVACNTASASSLPALQAALPIPVVGVVEPGARAAIAATHTRRIGVIGTPGTIRSGAYQRALASAGGAVEVRTQACGLFVPLVEEGWTRPDDPVVRGTVASYLAPLRSAEVDVLVLGCTHYPLLREAIADAMGPGVKLVDSAEATAVEVASTLGDLGLLRNDAGGGRRTYFVTDLPERFVEVGARFLGFPIEGAEQVDL
jgi:glutamate racemase